MGLTDGIDMNKSLQELENNFWPDESEYETGLVERCHILRKYPLRELDTWNLGRLIGQNIGLPWLVPIALEVLREAALEDDEIFYEGDLLFVVAACDPAFWPNHPGLTEHLKETVEMISDFSPLCRTTVDAFLAAQCT